MARDYRDYLNDMLRYAQEAIEIASTGDEATVLGDKTRRFALERVLMIVGEAATKVPAEVRARYPDVPWRQIVALRNRLVHDYGGLDPSRLYWLGRELLPTQLDRFGEIAELERESQPPT